MRRSVCAVLGLLAVVLAPARAATSAPDLDAVVSYETHQVLASGVSRMERWKERLVRRGDTVWTERLLPPMHATVGHRHGAESGAAEHAGHKHFNAEAAARWLSLDVQGQPRLRYVDHAQRFVVSVPKAEYGAVGFDGRWDAAAFIVPPAVVARMPVRAAGAAVRGGTWHVENNGEWSHRVLWSEARQVALRVESQSKDGSFRRIVSVELAAAGGTMPWEAVSGYAQKEYDDFMD